MVPLMVMVRGFKGPFFFENEREKNQRVSSLFLFFSRNSTKTQALPFFKKSLPRIFIRMCERDIHPLRAGGFVSLS